MASDYIQNTVSALRDSISDPVSRPVPLVLAATAGTLGAWLIWTKWRNRNRKLPPSPRGWPIIGNLLDVSDDDFHLDIIHLQKKYKLPDIFTLNLGPGNKMIILNSFGVIRDAFQTQGNLFAGRTGMDGLAVLKIEEEVFTADYSQEWKSNKAFLLSAMRSFGFGNTKSAEDMILRQFDLMVECLEPDVKNKEAVDLSQMLQNISANIIFEIMFNKSYSLEDPELANRVQLITDWFKANIEVFSLQMLPAWAMRLCFSKTLIKLTEDYRRLMKQEITEHQEKLDPENPKDFIDYYLTNKKGEIKTATLTNTLMVSLPDPIYTISCFLNWVILYLTTYPETMKRVQDEIEKVTRGNRYVTMSDRPSLPFAEAVIMEVGRLSPPGTTAGFHCTLKDCYFRGYFIPKNVAIIANLYNAMRDPDCFENPDEFNPERFLDKEGNLIICPAWIPFGMGARKCIGEQFTKTQLFLITTNLLQRYDLSFPDDNPSPTLKPQTGHLISGPQPFKVVMKPRI